MAKLADLESPAVLIYLARVGSAASGAKFLLELAVILLLGLVVRLNVDVSAVILGTRRKKKRRSRSALRRSRNTTSA